MSELLKNLTDANRICQAANEHYIKANELEQQNAEKLEFLKKVRNKWILIGAGVYMAGNMLTAILMAIPALAVIVSLASVVAAVFVGYNGYKKEKVAVEAAIREIGAQIGVEHAAAQQIFDDNVDALSFLPVDYWYPLATGYLEQLIRTERAHTLADALNRFEEQLHRWKIEEANAQMLATQQQQTAYLASIKTSSKISAIANVTNTVFNVASKL